MKKKELKKELRKELEKAQQVANDNADIGRILEKENKSLLEKLANETKRLNSQKKQHYKYTERLRSEIKEYKSFEGNVTFPLIDDKVKGLEKENKLLKASNNELSTKIEEKWNIENDYERLSSEYNGLFNSFNELKTELEISQAHCRKLAKQNNVVNHKSSAELLCNAVRGMLDTPKQSSITIDKEQFNKISRAFHSWTNVSSVTFETEIINNQIKIK